jgi:hypothetical protein
MDLRGWACLLLFILGLCPLAGQASWESPYSGPGLEGPEAGLSEPETLIGLTLEGLYSRFGAPQAVHAVRGQEEWQDDVVLIYPQGDFYVFRDRVWQLGLKVFRGLRVGDSREAVALALGEDARDGEAYFLLSIRGHAWPITLRVNLDDSGLAAGIFIYRDGF